MRVLDLEEQHRPLYCVCLEDWSADMAEAGEHKQRWYEAYRDRGLRVKLAEDEDGAVAGMIQYLPVEESPFAEGRDAYVILCIWVHGHPQGVGDRRGRGIGSALLRAAEEDARQLDAKGMAAWGLALPFWMRARWFRQHGYTVADRDFPSVLLWKPFVEGAEPPRWIRPRRRVEPGADRVRVTAFVHGWCPARNIGTERAIRAAAGFGDRVELQLIDTRPRETLPAWGHSDAIFIDGRRFGFGPPPSEDRIRRRIERAVRRRERRAALRAFTARIRGGA